MYLALYESFKFFSIGKGLQHRTSQILLIAQSYIELPNYLSLVSEEQSVKIYGQRVASAIENCG